MVAAVTDLQFTPLQHDAYLGFREILSTEILERGRIQPHKINWHCPRDLMMQTQATRFTTMGAVIAIASGLAGCGQSRPAEHLSIEQEIQLSPGHHVAAYHITPAGNGDYIITGANTLANSAAWAIRVGSFGAVRWEFLDGPPNSWTDYSGTGQFDSAVDLSNGNTLLCGSKMIGKRPTAFMVRVGIKGDLIDERLLVPREDGISLINQCTRWGAGVAVRPGMSGDNATGWLIKLDPAGDVLWEKYGDEFKGVATQSPANELLLLLDHDHGNALEKLDDSGQVATRQTIQDSATEASPGGMPGALQFFPSYDSAPGIHISAWFELDDRVRFMKFDPSLQGPAEIVEARTVGIRKAVQLADGSFIIFGSQRGNPPFASIARVYGDLKVTDFAVCDSCGSPWIYDGAIGRSPNEFVIIQEIRGTAIMSWISLVKDRPLSGDLNR
jgi:hypothetical protein